MLYSLKFPNMKNRILGIVLFLFSLYACHPTVDFALESEPSKLVIWCDLHPDSIVTAFITKTSPPLSIKADRVVTDALVILFENNLPVDTLQSQGGTIYKSRKKFKPMVGNIYFIKVSKQGFPVLETFPDTMPPKPILIKYIAEDSTLSLTESTNLARLRLYTDKPKYFETYGISEGKYQYFNFLGIYGDATFYWENANSVCGQSFTGTPHHYFVKYNCTTNGKNDFYEYTKIINTRPQQLRGKKMALSLASITKHAAEISIQIERLSSIAFSDNNTELFWTPIYIPETVKNGYGFLMCYNTLNFEVQF